MPSLADIIICVHVVTTMQIILSVAQKIGGVLKHQIIALIVGVKCKGEQTDERNCN